MSATEAVCPCCGETVPVVYGDHPATAIGVPDKPCPAVGARVLEEA